ncbi:hypothetical protein ACP4OV_010499 [Aristida adscensionis]
MDMVPCYYDGDADYWYQALHEFQPIATAPPAPGHLRRDLDASSHLALTADYCSSSALTNLREDDNYCLPLFAAPPVADDLCYSFVNQLPPMLADETTAGLDDAPLQPFSDIDLEAFGDADEHKAIMPADHHDAVGQNAGVDDARCRHSSTAIIGADCYAAPVENGLDVAAVRPRAEQHRQAATTNSVAALSALAPLALPQPRGRRSCERSAAPAGGKTRLDHIGFDELRRYFYMPIAKAAREMNVGLTVLKKRCRELGVARWPHRKMKSLKSLIHNVQEMGTKEGMSPAAVQRELEALEAYCELMEENPSIELTDRTKKLRQACFKESYKRRRAAAVNVIDHSYNLGYGHPLPAPSTSAGSQGSNDFFAY